MGMRRRTWRTAAFGVVGALALGAWALPVLAADQSVDMSGFAFSPSTVTVGVGDDVTWMNSDAVGHNATATDNAWATGTVAGGASAAVTFATAGTFDYRCTIHPDMTGTVVVQAGAASSAPTAPTTDSGDSEVAPPGDEASWLTLVAGLVALVAALALLSLRLRPAGADDTD